MAKYRALPVVVDAWKITAVSWPSPVPGAAPGGATLVLDDGRTEYADAGMTARYVPRVGDYFVRQDDGYLYINPAAVFDRKYGLVPEQAEQMEGVC